MVYADPKQMKAPPGKYRLAGIDTFSMDHDLELHGDLDTQAEAEAGARSLARPGTITAGCTTTPATWCSTAARTSSNGSFAIPLLSRARHA